MGGSPAPYYPPAPIWTGLYGGIHAGYGWGTVTADDVDLGTAHGRAARSRAFMWATTGNKAISCPVSKVICRRTGSMVIAAFGSGLDLEAKNDWTSSMRVRLGYAFSNVLVYATGGIAFGKLEATVRDPLLIGSENAGRAATSSAAVSRTKLSQMMSVRGEMLHYGYGSKEYVIDGVTVPVRSDETVGADGPDDAFQLSR